jgi:hypothetical protein
MSKLDRRDFLKLAALGVSGAAIPALAGAAATTLDVDAVEGMLLNLRGDSLDLQLDGQVRTFLHTARSAAWRAGDVTMAELQPGESVLVRFDSRGVIEHAWSNLSRFQGQIVRPLRGGYRVKAHQGDFRDAEIDIFTDGGTLVDHPLAGRAAGVTLPAGAAVDVIGFQKPHAFWATLIYHLVDVPAELAEPAEDSVDVDRDGVIVTATYSGYATWFNCGTRAGACGSCNTGRSDQVAWPSIGTGCRFSGSCKNQVVKSCGSSVAVKNTCNGRSKTCSIADCGPNENALCSRTCTRCGTARTPFIDLTKPTFAVFDNPAVYGCFSCTATV